MAFWRVRATLEDRPGYLSVLTASLALRSVNILSVQVHTTEAGAVDDFLIDAPDPLTEADLLAAVAKGRGRDAWVGRTDVRGLVDTQTQLLGVAARLVGDPDELGPALAGLLGGAEVSWSPRACPAGRDFDEGVLRLPDPAGGTLLVRRDDPPLTPAEFARAHALVDLAAAVLRRSTSRWQLMLPGGEEVTIRPAGVEDAAAIAALYAACSPVSRHGRHPSGTGGPDEAAVRRRLEAPGGTTLIAEAEPEGYPVGVADLDREGTEARVGVLVSDGYQGRGVGTALLRRAARLAEGDGVEALHAYGHPDNVAMVRTMRRLGRPLHQVLDGALLSLTADLRPASGPGSEPAGPHAVTGPHGATGSGAATGPGAVTGSGAVTGPDAGPRPVVRQRPVEGR